MISLDQATKLIREKYPHAPEEKVEEAARDLIERLKSAATEVEQEEILKDLQAPEREGDFSHLEDVGMYGVQVMSQRDEYVCDNCLDHDGSLYELQEAKEKQPVPHSDCENDECRCHYLPIPDENAYRKAMHEGPPDLSNLRD
jgi:hypothetical protein